MRPICVTMFTDPVTLAGDSSSTRGYALQSILDGNSVRSAPTAPVGLPEQLIIKHDISSRGGVPLARHLIRLNLAKTGVDHSGALLTASVYLTIEVPLDQAVTVAMLRDMRTQLNNFTTNANLDKILNNEP